MLRFLGERVCVLHGEGGSGRPKLLADEDDGPQHQLS